jgi:hypothetical protein
MTNLFFHLGEHITAKGSADDLSTPEGTYLLLLLCCRFVAACWHSMTARTAVAFVAVTSFTADLCCEPEIDVLLTTWCQEQAC